MPQSITVNFKVDVPSAASQPRNEEQSLIDQANAFFQAGSRCDANISLSPNVMNTLPAPAAVCFSFSIELYLKLLLHLASIEVKKLHSLADLFAALPLDVQKLAAANYQKIFGVTAEQFAADLKQASDVFVVWRYLHERREAVVSLSVLCHLGQALHQTARQVRPELKVTFENRLPP